MLIALCSKIYYDEHEFFFTIYYKNSDKIFFVENERAGLEVAVPVVAVRDLQFLSQAPPLDVPPSPLCPAPLPLHLLVFRIRMPLQKKFGHKIS